MRRHSRINLAIVLGALSPAAALAAPFMDVTAQAGIPKMRHNEGVAIADVTGDRLPDIYLPNVRGEGVLLRNMGRFMFKDVTAEKKISDNKTIGTTIADFNADGLNDVYLVRGSSPRGVNALLMGTKEGGFVDVTEHAGVAPQRNGIFAIPLDYDSDGNLDIFIANWGDDSLFKNSGNGPEGYPHFTDVAPTMGMTQNVRSWGAVYADFDNNGRPDLLVARGDLDGASKSVLYLNEKGVFSPPKASFGGLWSMGAVPADFDGDGDLDLFLPNWEGPSKLFINEGPGHDGAPIFVDKTIASGINVARVVGAAAGDLDDDQLPDLLVAGYDGPVRAFVNLGGGRFKDASERWGIGNVRKNEGVALADLDRDGDLDIFVAAISEGSRLYQNTGAVKDYLRVAFEGPQTRIFGASVVISGKGINGGNGKDWVRRDVIVGHGFASQNPAEIVLPLSGKGPFEVTVTFSDGKKTKLTGITPGELTVNAKTQP